MQCRGKFDPKTKFLCNVGENPIRKRSFYAMSGKIRPENEVFMQCRGKSDPKTKFLVNVGENPTRKRSFYAMSGEIRSENDAILWGN